MDEIKTPEGGFLLPVAIETEMKKSYIDYSMSVIVSRALPDVRDGLKPVHRRIMYSMEEQGLRYSGKTRKCATVVGDVLGSYHPHGDASVYDALVRLGQHFSMRYMPIQKQGNFGGIDGSPAAAYRYTEAKMSPIAEEMVEDIKKETVSFVPNFDDRKKEPTVLPGKFPFLLVNGSSGIAVGMATNMPPHNLNEICDAVSAYIKNPDITADELCKIVKGPDFPTGGIIFGKHGIRQAYKTGRGKILIRGRFNIEVDKKGKEAIIFTEIPYQVRTTDLCARIGELARDKIIEGIERINDGSAGDDVRIEIDLKRGAIAKLVLNQLFSKTALQSSFGIINLALVNGRPEVLPLKSLIQHFVEHRQDVVTRRTKFDLKKAEERAHILRGLVKAIENIDEVIKIIKASRNEDVAKVALMDRFEFSEVQAQAIVDMRLGRLTSLRIEELKKELAELEILIAHLKDLLAHPEKILALISEETEGLSQKYGDKRRTDIVADEVEQINIEDLIKKEEMVILISNLGYIKRMPVSSYKSQGRGGKGSASAKLIEEDFINQIFIASTHDYIMFITSEGKAYWLKVHEIPEASKNSRGVHIKGLLTVSPNEEITTVVSLSDFRDDQFLFMATAAGVVKKATTSTFARAKTRGIIAIKLDEGDKLVTAILTSGQDEVVLITRQGQALRLSESAVRPMGRASRGVTGIRLSKEDELTGALRVEENSNILLMSEFGFGKRVRFTDFNPHGRGTGGQKVCSVTEKTGEIIGVATVLDSDEIMCITSQGKTLRVKASAFSLQGRAGQGVRVLTIEKPDMVIGVDRIAKEEDDEKEKTPDLMFSENEDTDSIENEEDSNIDDSVSEETEE